MRKRISHVEKYISKIYGAEKPYGDKEYSKLSKIHKYWARKPWYILKIYIEKYSKRGDLVLDPFSGSGSMGLESVLLGRNFIGYDLNPFACYLANTTLNIPFNIDLFNGEFTEIKNALKKTIMQNYLFDEDRYILYVIQGSKNKKKYNMVSSSYNFEQKKREMVDEKKLNSEVKIPKNLLFPDQEFPRKFYKDRFSYKGVRKVSDMFSRRNLYSLALIYDNIIKNDYKNKDLFFLALTNTLLHASILKSEEVRPLGVNNYWIPDDFIEENVWWRFEDRVRNVAIAKQSVSKRISDYKIGDIGEHKIFNGSATNMKKIQNESIDYIFTDPPYGDAIQYSELSYIWNCWINKVYSTDDEIIINPVQKKGLKEFSEQMGQFINESHRVLKDGKYFTLCFQNKDIKVWLSLAELMRRKGFKLVDISIHDSLGTPFNKNWAKFSPKSDFYITFKKGNPERLEINRIVNPNNLIEEIVTYFSNDSKLFTLNKAYDLFVALFIEELFSGGSFSDVKRLELKSIIRMFEEVIKNGNIQTRFL